VHLVVVDPGVGSARNAVVAQTETCLFVAPDNGVLTLPLRRKPAESVVRLTEKAQPYFRQPVSATFHGRDVFAPVAAHLATGLPPEALGALCAPETPVTLPIPEPERDRAAAGRPRLRAHVLYADRFGNLITDVTPIHWTDWLRESGETTGAARDAWRSPSAMATPRGPSACLPATRSCSRSEQRPHSLHRTLRLSPCISRNGEAVPRLFLGHWRCAQAFFEIESCQQRN
jgi:hypothetical protein